MVDEHRLLPGTSQREVDSELLIPDLGSGGTRRCLRPMECRLWVGVNVAVPIRSAAACFGRSGMVACRFRCRRLLVAVCRWRRMLMWSLILGTGPQRAGEWC